MRRTPLIALALAALLAGPRAAHSGEARPALRFPVVDLAREQVTGPAYVADRIELRLTPAAASALPGRAIRVLALRRPHLERLGLDGPDRVGAALGAWFEPEFVGETPPADSREPDFTTFYIAHLPSGTDVPGALARFRATPGIASADPIGVLPVSAIPNDSLWSASWWFDQVSNHDIHASAAWDVTIGDTSIVVAILDTGVLPYHPDLGGSEAGLAGQIWTNWTEKGGAAGVDDDGNGFVDDTWGWDFVANQSVATGEDGRDEDNDPNDFAGHGTFVAGLVGAATNNTIGVSGTAWQVRLMPVRVAWSDPGLPLGVVDMSYVAQGIRYATRMGASVINCSFATLNESGLYAAADAAVAAGVTIVAAAGNGGQPHELADREDVVAVAATDINDQVAGFSNLGAFVDLCAPGNAITSTFVAHVSADSIGSRQPSYRAGMNGTSFSAPLVTGAVALIQAHQKQLGRPPLTPMGAVLRLRETADDISAENPSAAAYGAGRLNLFRALTDPPGSRVSHFSSPTLGAPVILPGTSGYARLAYGPGVTILDSETGATLSVASVGNGRPSQLAGADLGGGRGFGLFAGGSKGYMYGFDDRGNLLPGWPRLGAGVFIGLVGGPALGDLDADGQLEVVCGSAAGSVFAWHADGNSVAAFPLLLDPSGIDLAPALAPLDTLPGVEIVVVTNGGEVHVLNGGGNELTGWPQSVSGVPVAPIVTRLGHSGTSAIVVAAGNQLHVFNPDGSTRWTATLPGTVLEDPAAADLDLDGTDEILISTFAPAMLCVYDSTGVAWTSRGFPVALPAVPGGPTVVGPLRSGGGPAAMLMCNGGLIAYSDSAKILPRFPEPGGAGAFPAIAELETSGQTEIAAGSGADSLLYIYAAGVGTWTHLASWWPTPRANDARTGTRLYVPGNPGFDYIAPAPIVDLAAGWAAPDSIVLTWTAPGGDGTVGTASRYDLRVTSERAAAQDFSHGARADLAAPDSASRPQRFAFATAAHGTPLFFSIRARDQAGNIAAPSNVATLITPLGGPLLATTLTAATIAESSLTLHWSVLPGAATYELRGARAPLDQISFASAPLRRELAAGAGALDSVRIAALEPGTSWWFALRARDATGATGPLSNVVQASLPVGGALAGRRGLALAVRGQPARTPVRIDWQGVSPGTRAGIEIFDLSGRRVRSLGLAGGRFGGTLEWNGRDDQQRAVPAGLYFARLTCGSLHAQARVVLLP